MRLCMLFPIFPYLPMFALDGHGSIEESYFTAIHNRWWCYGVSPNLQWQWWWRFPDDRSIARQETEIRICPRGGRCPGQTENLLAHINRPRPSKPLSTRR
ncbi:hypothetical protein GE09DRAFT_82050 [Coniochaeta sp. 2T2.1]|nr:hypothetical protein GE09DRAFT_82050 [Coniochaeta sp. 2T2.1]